MARLFFLVPASTAVMATLMFGETIDAIVVAGMVLIGVAVVWRKRPPERYPFGTQVLRQNETGFHRGVSISLSANEPNPEGSRAVAVHGGRPLSGAGLDGRSWPTAAEFIRREPSFA